MDEEKHLSCRALPTRCRKWQNAAFWCRSWRSVSEAAKTTIPSSCGICIAGCWSLVKWISCVLSLDSLNLSFACWEDSTPPPLSTKCHFRCGAPKGNDSEQKGNEKRCACWVCWYGSEAGRHSVSFCAYLAICKCDFSFWRLSLSTLLIWSHLCYDLLDVLLLKDCWLKHAMILLHLIFRNRSRNWKSWTSAFSDKRVSTW